ncbi:acylphosphatase, partial [bacterium]|nr:acylphosphatase [bacterium]
FVLQHARALNLSGCVRNKKDGHVEVIAEGDEEALSNLLTYLRKGPPRSKVTFVDETWESYTDEFEGFDVAF